MRPIEICAVGMALAFAPACAVDRQGGDAGSGGSALGGSASSGGVRSGGFAGQSFASGGAMLAGGGQAGGSSESGGRIGGSGGANEGGRDASGGAFIAGGLTGFGGATSPGSGSGGIATAGTNSGGTPGSGGTSGADSGGRTAVIAGGTNSAGQPGAGGRGSGGAGGAGDTTPPSVVSVVPANLAAGVTSNSSIKITFSEMMNPATVASALSVSSFTSANLTLSWDATGRILTITPANGLAYATGTSPATTTATSYTVSLKATATDIAGNSLSAFTSSFSTLRRINQTLSPTSIGSFNSYGWAIGDGPTLCPATDPVPLYSYVGLAISATYTAYLAFDTTPLGSPAEITAFESAALIGVQNSPKGDFYAKHRIYASKLQYHAVDRDAYSSPVTDDLGAFATSAATMASVSILGPFKTDVASGNRLQLYRLEPTGDADSTESYFTCAGFALKVTFLSP